MKKTQFMIHAAVTKIGDKGPVVGVSPSGEPLYLFPGAEDKEICQFAAECKQGMPIHHFKKAFQEMEQACLNAAIEAGLVTLK